MTKKIFSLFLNIFISRQGKAATFASCLIIMMTTNCLSQNLKSFGLHGNVVAQGIENPIKYATAVITEKVGPSKTRIADSLGNFSFDNLKTNKIFITISAVGYTSLKDSIDLEKTPDLVRKFVLMPLVLELKGVTISSSKPIVRQEIDRLVYNAASDSENKILTVLEMMKKIPLISADADDNILLGGKRSIKVLIDGKPSVLLDKNLKSVLRSMSASNIQRVELITVIPSKYEGEGLSGIINIITNRREYEGYEASVNSSVGSLYSNLGGSIDIKKGKWAYSFNGGTSWDYVPAVPSSNTVNSFGSLAFTQVQTGHEKYNANSQYATLTASINVDSLNLITFNAGITTENESNTGSYLFNIDNQNNTLNQSFKLSKYEKPQDRSIDFGINYQKQFSHNKNKILTFFYRFSNDHNKDFAGNESAERINYFTEDTKQNNRSNLDEHVWQVDYVTKVNKVSIELGLKDTYRTSYSDFTLSRLDSLTGSYLNDLSQANAFNYHQNILGAYNSYYLKLKYVGVKVGLRLEHTDNNADFTSSNTKLDQGYINFFPTVILQKLSKDGEQSFRLGYTMRLLRPGITLLNPFIDQSNPRNYISGNPYLQPVKTHNIDFAYALTKKTSLVTSLTYSFSNNGIQQLSTLQPDSVILTSYQNVGKRGELTFNCNLNLPITKQFSLTANGNLAYVWLKGYFDANFITNKSWQGFVTSYLNYKPNKTTRFSIRGGYYGPNVTLQGKSNSYLFSSLVINKQILKQQGGLSIYFNNPFQKYRKVVNMINTPNATIEDVHNKYFRNFSINFNYRFGQLKSEIKKGKRKIVDDDKVTIGNN